MKTCITCKKDLPENSFYPGLNQCKECRYTRAKERRQRTKAERKCERCSSPIESGNETGSCNKCREETKTYHKENYRKKHGIPRVESLVAAAPPGTKYCSVCEEYYPFDNFYKWDDRKVSICKKCKRVNTARHHKMRRDNGNCIICNTPLSSKKSPTCKKCKKRAVERYHENGDQYRAASRERGYQLKLAAFEAYGGCVCKCCGESEPRFLTIDHMDGDGAAHRRSIGGKHMAGKHFYTWLKKNNYPPGHQVLCWNCNCAKAHFGICPHEEERSKISLCAPVS